MFIYFLRDRDREWVGEGQRERETQNLKLQALSCQCRAQRRARTRNLSRSQMLSQLSHPGGPILSTLKIYNYICQLFLNKVKKKERMSKSKYVSFLKPLAAHICDYHFSQTSHMAGPSERERQLQGHMEKSWVQGRVNNMQLWATGAFTQAVGQVKELSLNVIL